MRVGKAGVTESVIAETKKSLEAHELIKVRIEADDRKATAETLAAGTDAHIAGVVGKVAILYRERDEDPEIELP